MKVTKKTVSDSDLYVDIDLFSGVEGLSESKKARLKQDAAETIIDAILHNVGNSTSPVSGLGRFASLNGDYKKKKMEDGYSGKPDLEREGDLLDALDYKITNDGIRIGYFSSDQAPKADGHNNLSGESKLPLRRFLPDPSDNQNFKKTITSEVEAMINDEVVRASQVTANQLAGITTKKAFFDLFKEKMPGATNNQIRQSIIVNPTLFAIIQSMGLMKWLM